MSSYKYIVRAGKKSEYSLVEFLIINKELIKDLEDTDPDIISIIISVFNEALELLTVNPEDDLIKRSIVHNLVKYFMIKNCNIEEYTISGYDPQIFINFKEE